MNIILNIARMSEWEAAVAQGYYTTASLSSEGFIHCSTVSQVVKTANRFFPAQQGLLLLCIDVDKLESEVKYEGPEGLEGVRTERHFPHIYGPLNVSAVARVVAFNPGVDGVFGLPEDVALPDSLNS